MDYDSPESVSEEWQLGDVILNRYEVREKFESGGMGLVYRVYHREWDIELAVKSPRSNFFETTEQVENFEREAETWVNLGLHPHIVSCYYVRRLGRIPRIFSEFVEGGTLSEWIRDGRLYDGGKDKALERVLDVAIQVAWGLHYAHEKGLVHQDVKPGNVLMMPDGTAKVSDFGLARARGAVADGSTSNRVIGQNILVRGSGYLTPEYASPEQFRGDPLTRSSDIWSWAVMVLEMMKSDCDWVDGRAAPDVLSEFYGALVGTDPVAQILNASLHSRPEQRPPSLSNIAASLIALYERTNGKTYPRALPTIPSLEAATQNNRAIALIELNNVLRSSDPWASNVTNPFRSLRESQPFNKTVQINEALFRWRYCAGNIDELNRRLDNILQMPGPAADPNWLAEIELAKLDPQRAQRHIKKSDALWAREAAEAKFSLKHSLQKFFDFSQQMKDQAFEALLPLRAPTFIDRCASDDSGEHAANQMDRSHEDDRALVRGVSKDGVPLKTRNQQSLEASLAASAKRQALRIAQPLKHSTHVDGDGVEYLDEDPNQIILSYGGGNSAYMCVSKHCETDNAKEIQVRRVLGNEVVFRKRISSPIRVMAAAISDRGTKLGMVLHHHSPDKYSHENYIKFEVIDFSTMGETLDQRVSGTIADTIIERSNSQPICLTLNSVGKDLVLWIVSDQRPGCEMVKKVTARAEGFSVSILAGAAWPVLLAECALIVKVSDDSTRLLVSNGKAVQLWSMFEGNLRVCLIELNLADFGIIYREEHLTNFSLDTGFEFSVDNWSGYSLLSHLRSLEPSTAPDLRLIKPLNTLDTATTNSEYLGLLNYASIAAANGYLTEAINCLDRAIALPVADVRCLLDRRDKIVQLNTRSGAVQCWHSDSRRRSLDTVRIKPFRAGQFLFQSRHGDFGIEAVANTFPVSGLLKPYGLPGEDHGASIVVGLWPVSLQQWAIITSKRNTEPPNVILEVFKVPGRTEIWNWTPVWSTNVEGPSAVTCVQDDTAIRVEDSVLVRASPNQIQAFGAIDGSLLGEATFEHPVSRMFCIRDSVGDSRSVLVAMAETNVMFELDRLANIIGSTQFKSHTAALQVESVSGDGSACILTQKGKRASFYLRNMHPDVFEELWDVHNGLPRWAESPDDAKLSPWGMTEPYFWTLSQCGKLAACMHQGYVLVLDLDAKKRLLRWQCQWGSAQGLCFDVSGRWLALAHSVNQWEVFELMWNPD